MITRRNLLAGMAAFIAAPAIIRVADLMPIKAFDDREEGWKILATDAEGFWRRRSHQLERINYADLMSDLPGNYFTGRYR